MYVLEFAFCLALECLIYFMQFALCNLLCAIYYVFCCVQFVLGTMHFEKSLCKLHDVFVVLHILFHEIWQLLYAVAFALLAMLDLLQIICFH